MRLLLLGGTSFFGKNICRTFSEAGWDVTLFTRGNNTPSDLPSHTHIRGDRNSVDDLRLAAEAGPWDAIIDNIAYDGTQVKQAVETFGECCSHYLLMSTVSVYRYADPTHQPLKENVVDYALKPPKEDLNDVHWKYARGKLEAERALLQEEKIPWTILRPPVVYGPDDITGRGFWYLARLLDGQPLLLAESGSQSFRLIYSQDVARYCLRAVETEKAHFQSYNIAQDEVLTLRQFVEDSAQALGVPTKGVSAPLDVLGDLGGPYANMINLVPDLTRAHQDLGLSSTPWAEFGPATARWFAEQPSTLRESLLEGREAETALAKKLKSFYSSLS